MGALGDKIANLLQQGAALGENLVDEEGLKMSIMLKVQPKEYVYMFLAGVGAIVIGSLLADGIRSLYKK